MLIRLTGEQIAKFWKSEIKEAIREALPMMPADSDLVMNNVLRELLSDRLQCWVVTSGEDNKPLGICTTQVTLDSITGEKNMLIYTTYAFDGFPKFLWEANYLQLAGIAKELGCARIYCYSDNPIVIEKAKENGADSSQVLLSFPLL